MSWLWFLDWGSAHQHSNKLMSVVTNISQYLTIWRAYLDWHICSFRGLIYYIYFIHIYIICGLSPNYGTLPTTKRTDLFALYTHFGISTWHCSLREKPVVLLFKDEEFPNLESQINFQGPQTRTCFNKSHGFFPQFCWAVQRVQTASGGEWTWISDVESLGALAMDSILGWGQSQGRNPMTDPWDARYIYPDEWLICNGKYWYKYTSPMDPMGHVYVFVKDCLLFLSFQKTDGLIKQSIHKVVLLHIGVQYLNYA